MEWQEFRSPEDRLYWFNTRTQESVWEKPEALKSPQDKAMDSTSWKQYMSGGRPYYVHKTTQETTWDQPEEVSQALSAIPAEPSPSPMPTPPPPPPPGAGAGAPAFVPPNQNIAQQPGGGALVGMGFAGPGAPPGAQQQQQQQQQMFAQPDFALWSTNPQAALQAFKDLLRQVGVNPQWTWEQTMRSIITAPAWKAFKTGEERRAAFEDYQRELREAAKEKRRAALDRMRPAWREALGSASEMGMKSWWPWSKTRQLLMNEFPDVWRLARDDSDRQEIWQDYVDELKTKEAKREQQVKERNIVKLTSLLDKLELDRHSTWRDTRRTVERSSEFQNDGELQQTLDSNDFLSLFEQRMDKIESGVVEQRIKVREEKRRRVRKERDAFASLLEDLREEGLIRCGTTWSDIWPRVKDDERLHNMLGNPGSSPLELFWDIVDEMDERVEEQCRVIEGTFVQNKIDLNIETTWEQFQEYTQAEAVAPRIKHIDAESRKNVYNMIHERFERMAAEDKRRAEKKLRNAIDDLRYAIRDLEPEVEIETTYEDAKPRFEELKEYKALPDDESRRAAFDKYIARAKERKEAKEAEERERAERDAARRDRERSEYGDSPRRSSGRDRDRDRERDRERETSSSSRRDRKRSPSPHPRDLERSQRPRRERDDEHRRRHRDRDERDRRASRPRPASPGAGLGYGSPDEDSESPHKEKRKRHDSASGGMDVDSPAKKSHTGEEGEI